MESKLDYFSKEELRAKRITKDIHTWNKENDKSEYPDKIPIHEIFLSYEGEGRNIGKPRIFVRVQGCSVGCQWCDSKNTWHIKDSEVMTIDTIVNEVIRLSLSSGVTSVSMTGGEPLQFPKPLVVLMERLKATNFDINLETSGMFFSPKVFSLCDTISMDVKTPESGVILSDSVERAIVETSQLLKYRLHLKYVVKNDKDIDFVKKSIGSVDDNCRITLTPCLPEFIHESKENFDNHIKDANSMLGYIQKCGLLKYEKDIFVIVQQHKLMDFR